MSLIRPLLLVIALLFSQHAALLHGLAHAERDIALAMQHDGTAPALDHGADVCVAFGSLAHALGGTGLALCASEAAYARPVFALASAPAFTRIVFDSRAPPLSA
jgi:hypothetical protein